MIESIVEGFITLVVLSVVVGSMIGLGIEVKPWKLPRKRGRRDLP